VYQTKDGEKKYISRLKLSGGKEIYLGSFETEAEAGTTRDIANFLCRNNKDGYLDLDDDCYYDGVPPIDDEQRYFVIPPLGETTEGEKKAVKKRSKEIYKEYKQRKERSLLLWYEKNLMRDDDAGKHVNGHCEAGPSGLVPDHVPDSAAVVVPDDVGAANQLCQVGPPFKHRNGVAETSICRSQDCGRTEAPYSQAPSIEVAAPISLHALLSNSTSPPVESTLLQLYCLQQQDLQSLKQEFQSLKRQLENREMERQQEIRELKQEFENREIERQQEIRELKQKFENQEIERQQEIQELKRQLAEHLSCCSEENRPTKKRCSCLHLDVRNNISENAPS
jgi:hypothetical protein